MVKIFELDHMVNTNFKNSSGLFLYNYIYQANRHFVEFPESMRKQLGRNRGQHSNTPALQYSGIWHNEDKNGE
jgi:hypothetical protein